jgi:hypothetical protein
MDQDVGGLEWWRGQGNPSMGWCVGGAYIVASHRVGSGRTGWFHLVLPDSDRLAHLGLC